MEQPGSSMLPEYKRFVWLSRITKVSCLNQDAKKLSNLCTSFPALLKLHDPKGMAHLTHIHIISIESNFLKVDIAWFACPIWGS